VNGTGKLFTTNFRSFNKVKEMLPDAAFFAVCVGRGWKRRHHNKGIIWRPKLGPTKELLGRAMSGEVSWEEYREKYLEQMAESEQAQEGILELANKILEGSDIVLMCYCKRGDNCHRHLLDGLVLAKIKDLKFGSGYSKISNPNGGEILC